MQNYTIKISENNAKAVALINYLKTLEFVELTKASDWWDELGTENKASIERGLDDFKTGRTYQDNEVRNSIRERILKANKG
jgi:hypothetical protein